MKRCTVRLIYSIREVAERRGTLDGFILTTGLFQRIYRPGHLQRSVIPTLENEGYIIRRSRHSWDISSKLEALITSN